MDEDLAGVDVKASTGVESTKSATSLKKLRRYQIIKLKKKEKRKEVKARQKIKRQQQELSKDPGYVSKRDRKEMVRQRNEEALRHGVKVAINCSFEKNMNQKECCKLAGQIRRLYGANMKSSKPFHIYLANMDEEGRLFKECVRQNDGFVNYMIDRTSSGILDLFPNDNIIILTPDSPNVLDDVDPDSVYVIGGLVDHQVLKGKTVEVAAELRLETRRLPIMEYMRKNESSNGTGSNVLTVNQVFQILLDYCIWKDWTLALSQNVPKRTGWILKSSVT